jgi:beta-phosphoglucomutase
MNYNLAPSAVIFDFDGVVVDSLAVHLVAWQKSYQKLYGQPLHDIAGLPGRSTKAISEILSVRAGKPNTSIELADLKRKTLQDNLQTIQPFPGAKTAFEFLSEREIPFGIASNAPRAFIISTLERLNLKVEHIFGSDDVLQVKPAPDVFLKCARSLQMSVLRHPQIMVFEDSTHGLKAAVSAGMFPIGVLSQNSAEQMISAGARAVCQNIEEAITNGWFEKLPSEPQGI